VKRKHARASLVAVLIAAAFPFATLVVPEAVAAPTVWGRARRPDVGRRATLLEEADQFLLKHELARSSPLEDGPGVPFLRMGPVYLIEARKLLEQAGGAESPDPRVRLRFGHVLRRLAQEPDASPLLNERAAEVLVTVARSDAPPVITSAAWNELAICYAVLGRRDEEVHAYGEALALEPLGHHRAVLLSNRAESYMAMGRLDDAIRGYREALRSLLPLEMFEHGVTTFWGLAVALDRDGDLDGALESISLARAYDRDDRKIQSDSWFFSPPHDEPWYSALGAWSAARATEQGAVRAEMYERAIEQWRSYLTRAPEGDRWIPLARARLKACEKERDRSLEAARRR
jgi:tetratricopeptide (TPR) repeat protein